MSENPQYEHTQALPATPEGEQAAIAAQPTEPQHGATAARSAHRLVSSTVVATWVGAVVLGAGTAVTVQAFASDGHPTQSQGQRGGMGGFGRGMGVPGGMGRGGMGGMGGTGTQGTQNQVTNQGQGNQGTSQTQGSQAGTGQAAGGTQAQGSQQAPGGMQGGQMPAAGSHQQNQNQAPPA